MVLSRSMMIIAKNTFLNLEYHVASEICFQPLHPDTGAPLHVWCASVDQSCGQRDCVSAFLLTPALVAFLFLRDVTVARAT